jgi:hypothetical protein
MIFTVFKNEEKLEELRAFLKEARIKFRQEAMYFEFHPVFQGDIQ